MKNTQKKLGEALNNLNLYTKKGQYFEYSSPEPGEYTLLYWDNKGSGVFVEVCHCNELKQLFHTIRAISRALYVM